MHFSEVVIFDGAAENGKCKNKTEQSCKNDERKNHDLPLFLKGFHCFHFVKKYFPVLFPRNIFMLCGEVKKAIFQK